MEILVSWIGDNDLKSLREGRLTGPVNSILKSRFSKSFDEVCLLYNNFRKAQSEDLIGYFKKEYDFNFTEKFVSLTDPTDYEEIYENVVEILDDLEREFKQKINYHFHVSPGTNQMASIWLLLSETRYDATLYKSYKKDNDVYVKKVNIPFEINAEFIKRAENKADEDLIDRWEENLDLEKKDYAFKDEEEINQKLQNREQFLKEKRDEEEKVPIEEKIVLNKNIASELLSPPQRIPEEFSEIKSASRVMDDVKRKAAKMGAHNIPVLILGESGTGKELFARAIHDISKRKGEVYKVFNCSTIDKSLANATLFGWSQGAFTGAKKEDPGLFRECHKGTLFLDEIADLDITIQTKLLRAIENGEIQRVGDRKNFKVDVRIVAATNKNIMKMVSKGEFREDLFHRLNVGILKMPPLRNREDDIRFLSKYFLEASNEKFSEVQDVYDYERKSISDEAKKFIKDYTWPGNVRELKNTIQRACLWGENKIISKEDIESATVNIPDSEDKLLTDLGVNGSIDIENILKEIRKKYIKEALKFSGGNITKASEMLGYNNYQTLNNHIEKLGIEI